MQFMKTVAVVSMTFPPCCCDFGSSLAYNNPFSVSDNDFGYTILFLIFLYIDILYIWILILLLVMDYSVKLPKSAVLELTYKCNHKCLFCSCPWYAPNSNYPVGEEMNLHGWMQTVCRLYDAGVESFSITGGEAILKKEAADIIRHIRAEGAKRGINRKIVLISNGRAMNDEWLRLFNEQDVHLCLSVPGYKTFKKLTGYDHVTDVLRWFQRAKELGVTTTANITVTKINYGELFQNISMPLLHGASTVLLNRFLPGGRGLANMDELLLSHDQLKGMLDTAEKVLSYAKRYGSLGTEIAGCSIDDELGYEWLKFGYRCSAASHFFVVDPAGQIRTCNHSPRVVGHVLAQPMIADVDYWRLFADSTYKPQSCDGCNMKKICDGGCREVANILHGDPTASDTSLNHQFKKIV